MERDIFTNIRANYNMLTRVERKIADIVLAKPKEVLNLSITDLAELCDVSVATVFRFCKDLKLKGYQDFKLTLVQSISTLENEGSGFLEFAKDDQVDDDFQHIVHQILNVNVHSLKETCSLIQKDDVIRTVEWMVAARKIVFAGCGNSLLAAMEGKNKFMRITDKIEVNIDTHLQSMAAALLTEQDLIILISHSGSTKDTVEIAKLAKKQGAKVVCITRYARSPLTDCCDIRLMYGANEGPLQGGSMSAKLCQLMVLEVLYQQYFMSTFEDSKKNRTLTADSVVDKLY